jgi:hypothetical protein
MSVYMSKKEMQDDDISPSVSYTFSGQQHRCGLFLLHSPIYRSRPIYYQNKKKVLYRPNARFSSLIIGLRVFAIYKNE